MSEDSVRAARACLRAGHHRSAVNRAYHAAYCAATEEIRKRVTTFPHGRNNPPHDRVPWLVQNNTGLSQARKNNVSQLLEILRIFWEDADYRPADDVSLEIAQQCVQDAMQVQYDLWGYAR